MSPFEQGPPPVVVVSSWNWPSPTLDATEFRKWFWFKFDWVMKNWLSAVKLMIVPAVGRIPGTRRSPPIQRVDRSATLSGASPGLADGDGEAVGAPTPRSVRTIDQEQSAEDDDEGRRDGGQDRKSSHLVVPQERPTDRTSRLRRRLRGLEDGGDHAIGRLVGSQLKPCLSQAVEVTFAGHAIRPSWATGAESASTAERRTLVA